MEKRPFYRKIRRTLYETVSDSGNSVMRYRGHDDKEYYVASSNDPNIGPGGGMIEVTWQELKNKRDAGELTPGSLYRITDYQCTTTQENTKSAGHQFDIVLLALSENKLAEEGWAMMHDNIYDVTFADGVTKKCYINIYNSTMCHVIDIETMFGYSEAVLNDEVTDINEINKTATCTVDSIYLDTENLPYNYFQNSNLSAWKVWYCLDNDKSRFAWADDGETESINMYGEVFPRNSQNDADGYYAWGSGIFTKSSTPKVGDITYLTDGNGNYEEDDPISAVSGFGRGVIYRLIDEFNNDIKYDFKNIQFKRTITDGQYDERGNETWCYTLNVWYDGMCQDASIVGNTLPNDEGFVKGVYDNIFGYASAYYFYIRVNTFAFALGNNVVLSLVDGDGYYYGIHSNTIGDTFFNNTIGDGFISNIIGNMFNSNIIGNNFYCNTIGNGFYSKTISDLTNGKNYGNYGVELATKNDLN